MSAETARAEFEYNNVRKIAGYIMLRDFHDIGLTIETGEPDDIKLWRIHLRYDKYNQNNLTWIHKNVLGPHKRILCAVCHMDLYKSGDFLGKSAFCETCQSEVHLECDGGKCCYAAASPHAPTLRVKSRDLYQL